jgi:phosphocarrier protein
MVLRRSVVIPNSRALHARAAAKLVSMAERFSACVNVVRNGETVPACSIMGLMMLGAGQGAEVMIEAEGWDAKEALRGGRRPGRASFHEDLTHQSPRPGRRVRGRDPGHPVSHGVAVGLVYDTTDRRPRPRRSSRRRQ